MNIDTLMHSQIAGFMIEISNTGGADFLIDHINTNLIFSDSTQTFIAYSDTSSGNRNDYLPADSSINFFFEPMSLVPELLTGTYLPLVTFTGTQNGAEQTHQFSTIPDSISPLLKELKRALSLTAIAPQTILVTVPVNFPFDERVAEISSISLPSLTRPGEGLKTDNKDSLLPE